MPSVVATEWPSPTASVMSEAMIPPLPAVRTAASGEKRLPRSADASQPGEPPVARGYQFSSIARDRHDFESEACLFHTSMMGGCHRQADDDIGIWIKSIWSAPTAKR